MSFISLYSFSTLFIKTNSSWLITETIETLEIKTSVLFNLDFSKNTVSSCFFFSLIIDLNFLIPVVIAQIFNLIAELVIPIRIPRKESETEIEVYPVILEAKTRKISILFRVVETFFVLSTCHFYTYCK